MLTTEICVLRWSVLPLPGHFNSLARRLLGWEPKVRFIDGLHRTIDWYFATKDREQVRATLDYRLTER